MVLNGYFLFFPLLDCLFYHMKHTISTRRLANSNLGCSHFPHNFRSPCEYHSQYQSEVPRARRVAIYVLPIMLTVEMVIIFEHVVKSFSKQMSIWHPLLAPHLST
jgi:hypothetical protein